MKIVSFFYLLGILSFVMAQGSDPIPSTNKKESDLCGQALHQQPQTTSSLDTSCASTTCHDGSGQYVADATTMSGLWNNTLKTNNTLIHSDEIVFGEKPPKVDGVKKEIVYKHKIGYQIHGFTSPSGIKYHCIVHISPDEKDQNKILKAPSYCEDLGENIGHFYFPKTGEAPLRNVSEKPTSESNVNIYHVDKAIRVTMAELCDVGRFMPQTIDHSTPKPYQLYKNSTNKPFEANYELPPPFHNANFFSGRLKIMTKEEGINNKILTCFSIDYLVGHDFLLNFKTKPGTLPCFVRDEETPNAMARK